MLNSGRGEPTSAACRVCCMRLALMLEFLLLFSIGTASSSWKEIGDPIVKIDSSLTVGDELHNVFNSYPALQEFEVYSTQQDSLFPQVARGSYSRPGLLSLLRKLVGQLSGSSILNSRPVKKMTVDSREDSQVTSSTSNNNRRLGPGYPKRRLSSPRSFRALEGEELRPIRNEGRRVLQETVSSPVVPQTQVVHLGPPAPPDLLNNEKQDWNQDYAEPDVHPPSSN